MNRKMLNLLKSIITVSQLLVKQKIYLWQQRENRIFSLLLIYVLVLLTPYTTSVVHSCPDEVCICKWKSGKQTVECGGQQLPNIPEGMDPGTQVLNFTSNSLQVLQSERFLRMDLLNLQKIYLSRNQLIRIHEKAFRGLSNLVELDLSDNALQNIPSETFQDYSSLMRLTLNGNPIRELKTSAFRHLSFLTTLELSNCQIERIEDEAFVGMDNLEWLRLDGNRISFIQGGHILPKSLHGINLQSNRWTCDCRLLDLHAWLINYDTPQTEEPKCMEPAARLKGQIIKSLKKDELACLPEVTPTSTYTEVYEGRNISIVCIVRAIPEPKVLWLFNGQVMTNDSFVDNLHIFYYIDETVSAEEKRSEIFIYNVGTEDNGTFSCVGQNVGGTTFSNYTLRVIIEEPPLVNEVQFPRDYINYIIASSMGASVILFVLLCTIIIKCKPRHSDKRKKYNGRSTVRNIAATDSSNSSNANNTAPMKCSSIINDSESLSEGSAFIMGEGMTPTKFSKENDIVIGAQMQQNLLLFPPPHFQQQQQSTQEPDGSPSLGHLPIRTPSPPGQPGSLIVNAALNSNLSYCSPPVSLQNYQEKNPDLVNDAENVKPKLKTTLTSLDTDYDTANDCSGPCSIQGMLTPVQYENYYQLTPQFGSQIMRPSVNGNVSGVTASRFTAMTTLPRGIQLNTVMNNVNNLPQQQVDAHLNSVCFLGQDGFAYDYSNSHLQQSLPMPSNHHLHLQQQHSLGSRLPETVTSANQQEKNFYRTLPHNRAHKQQQFATSAANPTMRYSLETEFLQRSDASTYDKYLPSVRFTAEGYPQPSLVLYPSPPEGYKSNSTSPAPAGIENAGSASTITPTTTSFRQWPSCLPGYHVQPLRYQPTIIGVLSPNQQQKLTHIPTETPSQMQQITSTASHPTQIQGGGAVSNSNNLKSTSTSSSGTITNNNNNNNNNNTTSASNSITSEMKKRCIAAQADTSTILECDETEVSPTTTHTNSTIEIHETADNVIANESTASTEQTSKLRHLNGPLADSPDEGYVGDSHEGSDI